jgi:hypothetical protein
VAELAPAGMVTDAGTMSAESFVVRVTEAPSEGAVSLRITVHRLLPPETGLDGPHASEVKVIGEVLTESVKVRGTLFDELLIVSEANKAGAVTEEGAVRPVTAPLAGAAALRVAVQVDVADPTTDVGLHVNEVRTAAGASERRTVCDELPRAAVTVAD